MLNVGIIGSGRITEFRHAPEYTENKRANILGFVDSKMARAKAMAKQFGGKAYPDVDSLLSNPDIDAVSVCVANTAHAEVTLKALRAGKHVLLEKPMAVTLQECQDIVDAARETGKIVMLGHNQRFAKAHVHAREMIRQGLIGKPLTFRTAFGHGGPECWTNDPNSWFIHRDRAAFGVLADLGIHKTDLIHFLLDDPIEQVSAQMGTLDKKYPSGEPIDLEDNATCLYTTRGGVMGTMHVSWTFYAAEDNSTRVFGTKGVLRMYDDPVYSLIYEPVGGDIQRFQLDDLTSNEDQKAGLRTNTGVIDAFVDSVLSGQRPPIDAAEALRAMKVVFAAVESAKAGRAMRIEQV